MANKGRDRRNTVLSREIFDELRDVSNDEYHDPKCAYFTKKNTCNCGAVDPMVTVDRQRQGEVH